MTVRQPRQEYTDAFGEETDARNTARVVKRITWRLQARAGGDPSGRARQRAAEPACAAELRMNPPRVRTLLPTTGLAEGQPGI